MDSIDEKCTLLKEQYDNCFNSWYGEKFLRGDSSGDACADLFKTYRECISGALEKRGLDVDELEVSLLETDRLKHLDLPADRAGVVHRDAATMQTRDEEKKQT